MKPIKYLTAIAILSSLLIGCSNSKNIVIETSPTAIYTDAQKKILNGNFKGAIQQLEALDRYYPFSAYSLQIQFDLIYAYYQSGNLSMELISSIDRFMRLHPTHTNLDYMLYFRGLTNMALDTSTTPKFFGSDCADRDPIYALAAFRDFTQLIANYPNSKYTTDSQKRMLYLKNRLAQHELNIAQYYYIRGGYVAVINRIENMIQKYPDTKATRDGLQLMKNAYEQLKLNEQADKVDKLIAENSVG